MEIAILTVLILLVSVIIHECAHGWAAYVLGDDTAKNAGRLTLNPIAHIDPVGTILLPLLLVLGRADVMIGWAKPVPYNPYNLSDQKYGDLKVAISGPMSNLAIACLFGIIARFIPIAIQQKSAIISNFFARDYSTILELISGSLLASIFLMSIIFCFINVLLMVFNLLPIPPLDGSKVAATFLPSEIKIQMLKIEPYGIFILIFLLYSGALNFISPIMFYIFLALVGF